MSFLISSPVLEPWKNEEMRTLPVPPLTDAESMEYFRKYCQENSIPLSEQEQLEDTCVSNLLRHLSGQPVALHVALGTVLQHVISTHNTGEVLASYWSYEGSPAVMNLVFDRARKYIEKQKNSEDISRVLRVAASLPAHDRVLRMTICCSPNQKSLVQVDNLDPEHPYFVRNPPSEYTAEILEALSKLR